MVKVKNTFFPLVPRYVQLLKSCYQADAWQARALTAEQSLQEHVNLLGDAHRERDRLLAERERLVVVAEAAKRVRSSLPGDRAWTEQEIALYRGVTALEEPAAATPAKGGRRFEGVVRYSSNACFRVVGGADGDQLHELGGHRVTLIDHGPEAAQGPASPSAKEDGDG